MLENLRSKLAVALARMLVPRRDARLRTIVEELARERRLRSLHRTSLTRSRPFQGRGGLELHLGCGPKHKAGWVNVDLSPDADLQLDLREDLPFDSGSVALIYSEHFLEHLSYPDEVEHLLRESMRVLEPGGVFSVGVPDAGESLLQYARGEMPRLMKAWAEDASLQWFPAWSWRTPLHMVNFFFRQEGEHKHVYDFETLADVLSAAGFTDVVKRPFNPELDSEDRRDGTLYVDARKLR